MKPCLYCHSTSCEPQFFDDERFCAVTCKVCGARGPMRPVLLPECAAEVARYALADWNSIPPVVGPDIAPSTEATERVGDGARSESSAGAHTPASDDAAAIPPIPRRLQPASNASAPNRGGGAGNSRARRVAERLRDWLMANDTSIAKAWKKLGASQPSLYALMHGDKVSDKTLRNIERALDGSRKAAKLNGVKVQKLPNKLPPITGLHPLPKHEAPTRLGSTR